MPHPDFQTNDLRDDIAQGDLMSVIQQLVEWAKEYAFPFSKEVFQIASK